MKTRRYRWNSRQEAEDAAMAAERCALAWEMIYRAMNDGRSETFHIPREALPRAYADATVYVTFEHTNLRDDYPANAAVLIKTRFGRNEHWDLDATDLCALLQASGHADQHTLLRMVGDRVKHRLYVRHTQPLLAGAN